MRTLIDHAANVYSQFGEDGIIAKIFELIGTESKVCIEFGAWDGFHFSNTANLWTRGWQGLLIEADPQRHALLVKNTAEFQCVCVNARVTETGADSLENILQRTKFPGSVDLLSIDVDGDDYYLFAGLSRLRPRVVICEYNPTIPAHVDLRAEPGNYFGCSVLSLVKLAESKGYRLVAVTDTNAIFVASECFARFAEYETSLPALACTRHLAYLISGFSGDYVLSRQPIFGFMAPSQQKLIGDHFKVSTGKEGHAKDLRVLDFVKHRRTLKILRRWKAAGKPLPPPHAVKQWAVRTYSRRFKTPILVETGTYLGEMVEALRHDFRRIYSIELDSALFFGGRQRFATSAKITMVHGDSATELPKILATISEPCLFWLDGHFSGGNTAKAALNTPVMREMESILTHRVNNHIVLIDDARLFVGRDDYPTLTALEQLVRTHKPGWCLTVEDDIIRIHPGGEQ